MGKAANLRARLFAHRGPAAHTGPTTSGWRPHFHRNLQQALNERWPTRGDANDAGRRIGRMPVLWLPIRDPVKRRFVEDNAIRLLTTYGRAAIDPCSRNWLGRWSPKEEVTGSHLWNVQSVKGPSRGHDYDARFLEALSRAINRYPRG